MDRLSLITQHAIRNTQYVRAFLLPPSFFLLALIYLWPLTLHPNFIPFPPKSQFTDLLITHLPNAEYIREWLACCGQLPLWNTQIFAGQPFAADPLAGLWYPPGWLLLVLPLPFAFNLLFALHLAFAGYGLYCFLRDEGLPSGPALLGGLAFCGAPKLIAHIGAGHVSLVFAVAWTPWLVFAIKRAWQRHPHADAGSGLKQGALAGACLALIFLADVRWAFYAAALGAAYWLALLFRAVSCFIYGESVSGLNGVNRVAESEREASVSSVDSQAVNQPTNSAIAVIKPMLAFVALFFSLSAVLAVPLAEFLRHSNRTALTLAEAAIYSLPPYPYLLGLVIPDLGGFYEWMTYLGVIPLLLSFPGLRRRTLFWAVVVVFAIAFSLGSNFVLFPLLFRLLPGLGFLRVPPRAWFIVALGVSIFAAYGAQSLVVNVIPRLLARYAPTRPHPHTVTLLLPLLCLLTFLDLVRVDSTLLAARPRPPRTPAAEWIAAQPGLFRVYSPSYSLPLGDGLQHVDGIDPLQLAVSARFIEAASGVRASGYSVTLPAFESDSPDVPLDVATANADATPDARLLGYLNVKYVAAEFPLAAPGLRLAQTFGRTRVYENTVVAARARVLASVNLSGVEAGQAEIQDWSPNRIEVQAEGPGHLILSEIVYPGWEAWVDGVRTPVETADVPVLEVGGKQTPCKCANGGLNWARSENRWCCIQQGIRRGQCHCKDRAIRSPHERVAFDGC